MALLVACFVHGCLGGAGRAWADGAASIWLSYPPRADFMRLVDSPEQWPVALSHTNVLALDADFVSKAGQPTLARVFAFLRQHRIAFALEAPVLTVGADGCGRGIEGYRPPGFMRDVTERIRAASGRVDYLAMDEPLWYGHFSRVQKPGAAPPCARSVQEVASDVASAVAVVRTAFPAARCGDEEPLPGPETAPDSYPASISQWADAYAAATHTRLHFLHWDVVWFDDRSAAAPQARSDWWVEPLRAAVRLSRGLGLHPGVFYNGDPSDRSGEAWVRHATERIHAVEGGGIVIDDAVFQTWMPYPRVAVPETADDSMTGLVARYVRR